MLFFIVIIMIFFYHFVFFIGNWLHPINFLMSRFLMSIQGTYIYIHCHSLDDQVKEKSA